MAALRSSFSISATKMALAILIIQFLGVDIKAKAQKNKISVEDFVNFNQMLFNTAMNEVELKLDEFNAVYEAKFIPLEFQILLLENKIEEAENILTPLEIVSAMTKRCVQKYRWQLPDKKVMREKITECLRGDREGLPKIMEHVKGKRQTLYKNYSQKIPSNLKECKEIHQNSTINHAVCVAGVISKAHSYTTFKKQDFYKSLKTAACSADYGTFKTVECSFNVLYNAIGTINSTLLEVFTCIGSNINLIK